MSRAGTDNKVPGILDRECGRVSFANTGWASGSGVTGPSVISKKVVTVPVRVNGSIPYRAMVISVEVTFRMQSANFRESARV